MPAKRRDITGQRFGRLVAVNEIATERSGTHWLCNCDCGDTHIASIGNLVSGNTNSCGCYRSELKRAQMMHLAMSNAIDLTGRTIGRLHVLGKIDKANHPYADTAESGPGVLWMCRCECGRRTSKNSRYLLNGDTKSCGCIQREYRSGIYRKHGDKVRQHPREYSIWRSMKSRCYVASSSNYRFYGALGVAMCHEWRRDFSAFLRDMGPCPDSYTIDRIDPFGNYEPKNCRWASWETQRANKRRHAGTNSESSIRR